MKEKRSWNGTFCINQKNLPKTDNMIWRLLTDMMGITAGLVIRGVTLIVNNYVSSLSRTRKQREIKKIDIWQTCIWKLPLSSVKEIHRIEQKNYDNVSNNDPLEYIALHSNKQDWFRTNSSNLPFWEINTLQLISTATYLLTLLL